jgi:GDPmannose 4,6-dehydratase
MNNIINKKQEYIELGNLDSIRDWGHAKDYVYGMWLMLQQDKPSDYVLGTGETHTVREFVELVFKLNNMKITWEGYGDKEIGTDQDGIIRIRVNPKYYRPLEVPFLKADSSKARNLLNWKPKYDFITLVKEMIEEEK